MEHDRIPRASRSHQIGLAQTRSPRRTHALGENPPSSQLPTCPTTSAAMIEPSDLSSSNRTLSASSLKDRLSKLSVTPLRPVAALQARVECVHSIPACLASSFILPLACHR